MDWRPTIGVAVCVWLAVALQGGCVFDAAGLRGGPGDAGGDLPDVAGLDAVAVDAGLLDAALPDADVPPDAGHPCLALDPPWWDLEWRRRRPIELGQVPADYTVTLELTGSAQTEVETHARADLNDLRVLRHDGVWQELDRMLQPDPIALRIRFRVREDQDGTAGLPRYFLYYDQPNATTPPSAPAEVFLFFDDFQRAQLGIGTLYEQWDRDAFLPGSWWIDNGELVQDGSGALTALVIPALAGLLDGGFAISYRWLGDAGCADSGPVFHFDPGASTGYYLERQYGDAVLFAEPSHVEQGRQSMSAYADGAWHWHELRHHGDTLTFREDGSGPQLSLTLGPTGAETVGVATYCPRIGPFRFDNLSVRRYQEPEPAPTTGPEQHCTQP